MKKLEKLGTPFHGLQANAEFATLTRIQDTDIFVSPF